MIHFHFKIFLLGSTVSATWFYEQGNGIIFDHALFLNFTVYNYGNTCVKSVMQIQYFPLSIYRGSTYIKIIFTKSYNRLWMHF